MPKQEGDTIVSASINKSGLIRAKATKVGEDTTIAQIIRLVEEASSSKAPIAKMADKIAGVFVPAVITIALITGVIWLISGATFEFAMSTAIAVLVISCPCATWSCNTGSNHGWNRKRCRERDPHQIR